MLNIKNLFHNYGSDNPTINDFNLDIKKGEIISITGASGSGKTTLLRLIAGLEKPSSGEIIINNKLASCKDFIMPTERRSLGLVLEERALFPHLSVKKNVMFGINNFKEKELLAIEYLNLFKIESIKDKFPHEISAGQQQRVAFARSLITNPDILMLDEPFSALDQKLKEELYIETKNIFHQKRLTVILVTHDEKEAKYFSDRIIEF